MRMEFATYDDGDILGKGWLEDDGGVLLAALPIVGGGDHLDIGLVVWKIRPSDDG